MSGVEFAFGKVVEPSPIFTTIVSYICAGDCGEDLAVVSGGIDFDAVGADVGPDLIFGAMQEESCVRDSSN